MPHSLAELQVLLQRAYKNQDFDGQADYFELLGDHYYEVFKAQSEAETCQHWQSVINAYAIYQYAIHICRNTKNIEHQKRITRKADVVLSCFFDKFKVGKFGLAAFNAQVALNKKNIAAYRKYYRKAYHYVFNENGTVSEMALAKQKIQDAMCDHYRSVLAQSLAYFDLAHLNFEVIAFGSLATLMATPYSDLEFAILTEHTDHKSQLIPLVLTYFLNILSLGETPLRMLDIDVLKFLRNDFNYLNCNGLTFDGMRSGMAKFPLPLSALQKKESDPPLIATPYQLAMLQTKTNSIFSKEYFISCLSNATSLYQSSRSDFLLKQYQYFLSCFSQSNKLVRHNYLLLKNDIDISNDIEFKNTYVFKHQVMKPFILILEDLFVIFTAQSRTDLFTSFMLLARTYFQEYHAELNFALRWLLTMQFKLYNHYQSQAEKFSVLWSFDQKPQDNTFIIDMPFDFCKAFITINAMRSSIRKYRLGDGRLTFDYVCVRNLLGGMQPYLSRDNRLQNGFLTNEKYQRFLELFFNTKVIHFFETNQEGRCDYVSGLIRATNCIVTHLTQHAQAEKGLRFYLKLQIILAKLAPSLLQVVHQYKVQKSNVNALLNACKDYPSDILIFIQQMLYIESRFRFYCPGIYVVDDAKWLTHVCAGMTLCEHLKSNTQLSDEQQQDLKLDAILWIRSSFYYYLFDSNKNNAAKLLKLIYQYHQLIQCRANDLFHLIDCFNNMIKVYKALTQLAIKDQNYTYLNEASMFLKIDFEDVVALSCNNQNETFYLKYTNLPTLFSSWQKTGFGSLEMLTNQKARLST